MSENYVKCGNEIFFFLSNSAQSSQSVCHKNIDDCLLAKKKLSATKHNKNNKHKQEWKKKCF